MKEINEEARGRYYEEVSIHLSRAGFTVLPQKDGLLPLEWNGASLCRVTAGGGAQYYAKELEPEGASDAFHRAAEIAHTTAEYMLLMEIAPSLTATWLGGDYRLLADFGGVVLAGHPTNHGVEFVTWEWDFKHTGMWQGHYYGNNYAGAKQDFAVRSGLMVADRIDTNVSMNLDCVLNFGNISTVGTDIVLNVTPVAARRPNYSATGSQHGKVSKELVNLFLIEGALPNDFSPFEMLEIVFSHIRSPFLPVGIVLALPDPVGYDPYYN